MIGRKKRILIFGCGAAGRRFVSFVKRRDRIVGFLDNNEALHGKKVLGYTVYAPTDIGGLGYDRIIIASMYHRVIRAQLISKLGVPRGRIELAIAQFPKSLREKLILGLMRRRIPGTRPVLILDEFQWSWTKLRMEDVFVEGLRRRLWFACYEVTSMDGAAEVADATPQELYRGVQLFPAVAYALCVDLEVAMPEFDWENAAHRARASWWYAVARSVIDEMHEVLTYFRPRAVVGIQGYFVSTAVARQLAPIFGFQFFALENTFFQSRFICEPLSGIAVNKTAASLYFRQREDFLPAGNYTKWLDGFIAGLDAAKSVDHSSPPQRFEWPEGRKRIVFLGQCYTDSSVLFGARDGVTAVGILQTILDYVDTRSAFLLAKLHPKEKAGINTLWAPYDRLTWRKLNDAIGISRHLSERGTEHGWEVDEDNRYGTKMLLQDCDAVVTINSQGGLEALAYGKDVLLLGDAFYGSLGFTFEVHRLTLLPAILDAVLFGGVSLASREKVARFLYVYFHDYCIERTAGAFAHAIRSRCYAPNRFAAAFSLPAVGPGED